MDFTLFMLLSIGLMGLLTRRITLCPPVVRNGIIEEPINPLELSINNVSAEQY